MKNRRIDMHCHLLPKADHGSDSLETSLIQARNAVAAGICCTVATPHFYPSSDTIPDFLRRRERALRQLRDALKEHRIPLFLEPAAEVALAPGLADAEGLEKLCIGNSRYLLLELPNDYWTPWVFAAIYKIESERHLTPIIAHIDRYDPRQVERLFEMSLLTQVNADHILQFSRKRIFRRWLAAGQVHFLGSDAHGTAEHAYSSFAKACDLIERSDDSFMQRAARILVDSHRKNV